MAQSLHEPEGAPWIPRDTFASRLAQIRQTMQWNVKEAADACGLSHASWRNWEQGVEPRRLQDVAEVIAERTGCSLAWLVMGRRAEIECFSPFGVVPFEGQMEIPFTPPADLVAV